MTTFLSLLEMSGPTPGALDRISINRPLILVPYQKQSLKRVALALITLAVKRALMIQVGGKKSER